MGLKTFGTMAVDWEERVNLNACAPSAWLGSKTALKQSEIGSLLCFDMNNIRYITTTNIGTWAMDKLVRFCCCRRTTSPSFGISARRHAIIRFTALGSANARAPAFPRCAARPIQAPAWPKMSRKKFKLELEKRDLQNEPVGVDVIELPVLFALQAQGIKVVDGQQLMHEVREIKTQDEITLLNCATHDGRCGL